MSKIDYQALREVAKRAIPAVDRLLMLPADDLLSEQELKDYGVDIDAINAFKFLTGPENVLALLDERERNQQYIKRRDQENEDIALTVGKLCVELEASEKLIDTLRQDKDKVIDMSIERVNKLLSRAEAAERRVAELESLAAPKLTQQALVVPDEMPAHTGPREFGRPQAYIDGWNACRSAMPHGSEPETDNTNQQFESLSRGDK